MQRGNWRQKTFFVGMATGLSIGDHLFIDIPEVLLKNQLRKEMTGPKGPWEERGVNNFVLCPRNFRQFVKKIGGKISRDRIVFVIPESAIMQIKRSCHPQLPLFSLISIVF